MMNIRLVTRLDEIEVLAQRWDELALQDARDGFFRTSAWYLAWMKYIRPDATPFVVVAQDDDGKILGLAPLCRITYRDLGFRLQAVSWAGREVVSGDFLDFVSAREVRLEVTSAILSFLADAGARWNLMVMGELIEGGDSYCALDSLAKRNGLMVRSQEERICPYIALPGTFEEYLNSLSSSSRYHIRRRIRDLVDKKAARVEVYSHPEEITGHLDTLIRLHLSRWQKDNLPGTLGRPGFASFLNHICANPPAGSVCRLYLLTHEHAAVAALLMFHFGESALYYQAGWDPESELASHSPAVVLMAHSIRDAIESGLRYYEFLRGDESYKSHWTKTFRRTTTLLLARSFMANEYLRVAQLKDKAKHLLSTLRNPAGDPVEANSNDSAAAAPAKQTGGIHIASEQVRNQ